MIAGLLRSAFILSIIFLSTGFFNAAFAEEAFVTIDGQRVIEVSAGVGSLTAVERARVVSRRLTDILESTDVDDSSVTIDDDAEPISLNMNGSLIITVTAEDAAASHTTEALLAKRWANKIQRLVAVRSASRGLQSVSPEAVSQWFLQMLSHPYFAKTLIAIIGCVVILTFSFLARLYARKNIAEPSNLYAVRKVVGIGSTFFLIVFITVVFRDTLGNLAVIIGAITAGVAFALKTVITSLAGWSALTFGHYYKVGDRVQIAGIKGDVIDIGFVRTTLMELGEWVEGDLYTGRIVRVTNGFIFEHPVFNYTAYFPFVWDEIKVPVKFDSNLKEVRRTLQTILDDLTSNDVQEARRYWSIFDRSFMVEAARLEPLVTLSANDNWVEFVGRYVVNSKRRRVAKDKIFDRLLEAFEQSERRMQFASATFEIVGRQKISLERERNYSQARMVNDV